MKFMLCLNKKAHLEFLVYAESSFYLFVSSIIILFLLALIALPRVIEMWRESRRYRHDRCRFAEEVRAGTVPLWVPIHTGFYGNLSIKAEDLVHTKQFKEQLAAVKNLVASHTGH